MDRPTGTPLSFLDRAATVYPTRTAVIYGARHHDYQSLRERCRKLASALAAMGIGRGDTVSVILPNIPEMLECHYAVPMTGAVLNAINIRLDAATIRFILGQARQMLRQRDHRRCFARAPRHQIANANHRNRRPPRRPAP